MTDNDTCLVVPSIRESCIKDFLDRWKLGGIKKDPVDVIVMEDNPERTFDLGEGVRHLSWEDIRDDLNGDEWIIPRRSDTVRSYGYYWAWRAKYDFIMTLDDDCYPPTLEEDGLEYKGGFSDLVAEHKRYLTGRTKWFNTLNDVKPRGIPFENLGSRDDVVVNHGLWTKVLDYDAPTQLVDPVKEMFSFDNRIVPHGSYFPMCGMNVMWKAEFTVWMYHLLMGQWIKHQHPVGTITHSDGTTEPANGTQLGPLEKLPFDRFGDIWCGLFMKKCSDTLNKSVSTGMPYIRHERASNPFTNLKKEAPGLEVNERLWEHVDSLQFDCIIHEDKFAAELYGMLGDHIGDYSEFPEHVDYFKKLGEAMKTWAELFEVER